jgi:hypothetical protein
MIHLYIPSIPPSTNHAYIKTRGGGRALSPAGKKYKAETESHLVRTYPQELRWFKKNQPYLLVAHLEFKDHDTLYNSGYPEKTDNRYKKLDTTNRIKILEDSLSKVASVDDAHNWAVLIRKAVGEKDATYLWFWNLEDEPHNAITNTVDTYLSIAKAE